jgi:arginyl-tRNA synthetase
MKMLARYPEVVESCVAALDPHSMGAYLRELAQVFHRFYHQHRVLEEDEATAAARMALVEGVRVILGNGLDALGVEPPRERM